MQIHCLKREKEGKAENRNKRTTKAGCHPASLPGAEIYVLCREGFKYISNSTGC
jgi:hypothetical protein